MGNSLWSKFAKGSALTGVLALILMAAFAHTSARAQDDDEKKKDDGIWNLDKRFFDAVAKGIGLVKGGDPSVDYRERSPLVVPPTRDLPPPQSAPKRSAQWPVDPDATRRAASASSRKGLDRRGYDEDYENRALTPSELNSPAAREARAKASTSRTAGDDKVDMTDGEGSNLAPSQLGFFGFNWSSLGFGDKEEYGSFKKEPPRRSLTEPPVGYQTPSPAQPYGLGKEKQRRSVTPLDPAVGDLGNGN